VVALRHAYPGLCVTMSELEPEDSLRELQLADLDLVLAYEYNHTAEALGAGIERTELFAEAMSIVVPAGWVEPGVALELDDLKAEVWAAAPADTGCGRAVRAACRSAGFTPDVRYTSADFNVILHLIEAGAAVSVLPELAFGVVDCDYQVHPLAGPPLERRVFAAVRAGSRDRPSLRAALGALSQAAADRPQVLKVPVGD
jgi:DNA-binding transcriptional LysR family regulator